MTQSPTRRRFLVLSAAAVTAGCSRARPAGDAANGDAPERGSEATTETDRETATAVGTGGPDERVTAAPPADRPLSPSGTWSQAGFDAGNTGYDPDGTGVRDGERYWRLDAGRAPVVADDGLYNVFHHDVSPVRVTRRDPATAEVQASTDLVEYAVTSPPAVGEHVFVSTFVRPWAVSRDGGVAWEGPVVDGLHAPPTVRGDRVYVAGTGFSGRDNPPKAAALTAAGDVAWETTLDREAAGSPAADGDLTVVATDGAVIGLEEGEERWRYDAVDPDGTPVLVDDLAFVPGSEAVHAVDVAEGRESWRGGPGAGELVVTGGRVVADGDDGTVALDRATGERAWSQSRGGRPLAAAGSTLYTARDGRLSVLDLAEGTHLWSYETPEVRVTDMIFTGITGVTPVDGAVYVRAADALHGIGPAES